MKICVFAFVYIILSRFIQIETQFVHICLHKARERVASERGRVARENLKKRGDWQHFWYEVQLNQTVIIVFDLN